MVLGSEREQEQDIVSPEHLREGTIMSEPQKIMWEVNRIESNAPYYNLGFHRVYNPDGVPRSLIYIFGGTVKKESWSKNVSWINMKLVLDTILTERDWAKILVGGDYE